MAMSPFTDGYHFTTPLSLADLQQFEGTKGGMYFDEHNPFTQDSKATQERARTFFQNLAENLSTRDKSKSSLHALLERTLQLSNTEENQPLFSEITRAFFKQRGYLSRLFSHESWEEWTESRTALGKAASQFRDCVERSTKVSSFTERLNENEIQKANQEAEALLQRLNHQTEMTFQTKRCITGLLGGTVGSLLTKNPLPIFFGLSECLPQTYAQQKVGSEFQVNNYTFGTQSTPSVIGLRNGNFVVTWNSQGNDGSLEGVAGQLFYGNSTKIGSEFQVNTYTIDAQYNPSVASLDNDKFVVAWQSLYQDGGNYGIYGQLFDNDTNKTGSEFQINTYTISGQTGPSVANFNNGNFVVTWHSAGQDGSGGGIFGQLFDSIGNKIGNEFQINTFTAGDQDIPSVANLNDSNFVVTWNSQGQDGSGSGVYGQLFNENATKIGNEFQINSFTSGDQDTPSVANLNDSNFVVTWNSQGQDGSDYGVYGQLFNENATKIGNEFQINNFTAGDQGTPLVANLNDSNFIVTWHSYGQDGSDNGIYGQIFYDNITYPSTSTTTSSTSSSTTTSSTTSTTSSSTTSTKSSPATSTSKSTTLSSSPKTSNAMPSTSSPSNKRLLWLWLLLGIGSGAICFGGIGYLLKKSRNKEGKSNALATELGKMQQVDTSPAEEHYQRTPNFVTSGSENEGTEYGFTPDHVTPL